MPKSRNFNASLLSVYMPDAGTEVAILHGLRTAPKGWIVTWRSAAASLYLGATAWTNTHAYLRSNVPGAVFQVLFFV